MCNTILFSLKLAKELGLPTYRVGKPSNVRFAKNELHETKEVALNVNLTFGTFKFVKSFILC